MALCAAVSFWWLRTEEQEKALQVQLPQTGVKLSAWITDWQWRTGITDLKQLGSELEEIHFLQLTSIIKMNSILLRIFGRGCLSFWRFPEKGSSFAVS